MKFKSKKEKNNNIYTQVGDLNYLLQNSESPYHKKIKCIYDEAKSYEVDDHEFIYINNQEVSEYIKNNDEILDYSVYSSYDELILEKLIDNQNISFSKKHTNYAIEQIKWLIKMIRKNKKINIPLYIDYFNTSFYEIDDKKIYPTNLEDMYILQSDEKDDILNIDFKLIQNAFTRFKGVKYDLSADELHFIFDKKNDRFIIRVVHDEIKKSKKSAGQKLTYKKKRME